MSTLSMKIATMRSALVLSFLMLSALLGFASPASAALIEYTGANTVTGNDGVARYVQVWMIFDDQFVKNPGTPPQVPGPFRDESFGHFNIVSYTVDVAGVGAFAGTNGRLNIWYNRTPLAFTYYTEELEVLEDHGLMKFLNGAGAAWNWAPWFASPADYKLPPELMIPRLNVSPGYSYDIGNEIHLFPACRCKTRTLPIKG